MNRHDFLKLAAGVLASLGLKPINRPPEPKAAKSVSINPELERIATLERLAAWGYSCGSTGAIRELVRRGLATYEGAEMPDYEYGQITEAGREYLAEWREQNANPS